MSASDSARPRMDRILRLHEQVDAIKEDIKAVYAEEKADGGDKTAMGAAITVIRKREKSGKAFDEREQMTDVYLAAYERSSHTHAREGVNAIPPENAADWLGRANPHSPALNPPSGLAKAEATDHLPGSSANNSGAAQ